MVNCGAHNGDLQVGWLSRQTMTSTEPRTRAMFDPVFLNCWRQDKGLNRSVPRSAMYRVKGKNSCSPDGHDVLMMEDCIEGNTMKKVEDEATEGSVEWISRDFGAVDLMAAVCQSRSKARQHNSSHEDEDDEDEDEDEDEDDEEGMTPSEFALALAAQISIINSNSDVSTDDKDAEGNVFFVAVENVTTGLEDGSLQVIDIPPLAGTLILFDSVVIPHEVLPVAEGDITLFSLDSQILSFMLPLRHHTLLLHIHSLHILT